MPVMGGATPTPDGVSLTVKQLVQMMQERLGGYQNAFTQSALIGYLNEGKDELWAILKELRDEYFVTKTQPSDNSLVSYFPALVPTIREYNLPLDLQHIKFIEVVGDTDIRFEYRDLDSADFREARLSSDQAGQTSTYYYSIIGRRTMMLAQYPEALTLQVWYVPVLLDFDINGVLQDFLPPWAKKIVDYAVAKAQLPLQDAQNFEEWKKQWREDVITISDSAAPRNQADAVYVEEWWGED